MKKCLLVLNIFFAFASCASETEKTEVNDQLEMRILPRFKQLFQPGEPILIPIEIENNTNDTVCTCLLGFDAYHVELKTNIYQLKNKVEGYGRPIQSHGGEEDSVLLHKTKDWKGTRDCDFKYERFDTGYSNGLAIFLPHQKLVFSIPVVSTLYPRKSSYGYILYGSALNSRIHFLPEGNYHFLIQAKANGNNKVKDLEGNFTIINTDLRFRDQYIAMSELFEGDPYREESFKTITSVMDKFMLDSTTCPPCWLYKQMKTDTRIKDKIILHLHNSSNIYTFHTYQSKANFDYFKKAIASISDKDILTIFLYEHVIKSTFRGTCHFDKYQFDRIELFIELVKSIKDKHPDVAKNFVDFLMHIQYYKDLYTFNKTATESYPDQPLSKKQFKTLKEQLETLLK